MTKTLREQLAWLAGIVDGEGSITSWLTHGHRRKDGTLGAQLYFCVSIGNTDYRMIEELVAICERIDVGVNVTFDQPLKKNAKRHKPCWRVKVMGQDRVEKLLTLLHPFLINKVDRADHLLAMIRHRRKVMNSGNGRGRMRLEHDPVSMKHLSKLRVMNQRGPAALAGTA